MIVKFKNYLSTPKDRLLSAISNDGINWKRERGIRIDVGKVGSNIIDGVFYCYVQYIDQESCNFEMYFHASHEITQGQWHTKIMRTESVDGLKWNLDNNPVISQGFHPLCEKRAIAPYLFKFGDVWRMYFTGVAEDGVYRILSAISKNRKEWEIEDGARIDPLNFNQVYKNQLKNYKVSGVSDTSITKLNDGTYRMYFSARGKSVFYQNIQSAVSADGIRWEIEEGVRISPGEKGFKTLANNPCVIPFEKGWRMYFRGADRSPLGDTIFTAYSDDGFEWDIQGISIKCNQHRLVEKHEVAFPFVLPLRDGRYRMYYMGCCGNLFDRDYINYYKKMHVKEGLL
ncbi:MAG: hypothetical protein HOC71_00730 [Candidatus Latescibacteria bacterium]|jgi:predicted GH43/DUF377 family glycosyl hydrolase|nr:hypothetical protein [Candidatus Latescibacterota bacterium]